MTERELIEKAKEIVAIGCGCDRQCEELIGPDVYCGCERDAAAIIALVTVSAKYSAADIIDSAQAICQERCAHMGELPCYRIGDDQGNPLPWPPATCDDPGCLAMAEAALLAFTTKKSRSPESGCCLGKAAHPGGGGDPAVTLDCDGTPARYVEAITEDKRQR